MKTLNKTILVLLAIVAVGFTSCSKDDDGGSDGAAAAGTVEAKVDGSAFKSMTQTSTASYVSAGGSATVTLQGSDASGKAIHIIIGGFDGEGTYQLSDSNVFISASYTEVNVNDPMNTQTWHAPYQDSGIVGEVKVSELTDTNIKGTFNFKGKNMGENGSIKNLTDGSYNLSLTRY